MDISQQKTAILVVGGFHSIGLTEALREKKINYIAINPSILSLENQVPFLDKMTGNLFNISPILISNIQALSLYIATESEKELFLNGFDKEAIVEALKIIIENNGNADNVKEKLKKLEILKLETSDRDIKTAIKTMRSSLNLLIREIKNHYSPNKLTFKAVKEIVASEKIKTVSKYRDVILSELKNIFKKSNLDKKISLKRTAKDFANPQLKVKSVDIFSYIQETKQILEDIFDIKVNINKNRDNSTNVSVHSKIIGLFFDKLVGTGFDKKALNNDLLFANPKVQKWLLVGAIRGDGCALKEGYQLTMSNKNLIKQLFEISLRCGLSPFIKRDFRKHSYRKNKRSNTRKEYCQ